MAVPALERAAELLGLGNPTMWTVGGSEGVVYAGRKDDCLVAGTGRVVPNPDAVLRRLMSPLSDEAGATLLAS